MKKSKIFIVAVVMFLVTMCMAPVTVFADDLDLSNANIEIDGVKADYNVGDKPKATAYKCDPWDELYDIEYEYWEEMETNEEGEDVPVKFWYSDETKNNALAQDKKITSFEEGKTYMYSIWLKAKDENKFGDKTTVRVNGLGISVENAKAFVLNDTTLFIPAIKTIKPTKTVELKKIDAIELNNATISFNVGDKPVFTGKTPDNAPYIYQFECWQDKNGAGITSAEFFNKGYENKITAFESGKEYKYILYFKSAEGYTFTRDTKLKINGKYYNYTVSDWEEETDVNEFQTTWRMYPDLIMTPTSSEPVKDTIKEIKSTDAINARIVFEKEVNKNYKLDIKQIEIIKNLSDKNVKYVVDINILDDNNQIVKISNNKMKIRIVLPEDLKGFDKYEVVYILDDEIKETIPATVEDGNIVFETTHLSQYGIVATNVEEKTEQDKNETNNSETEQNENKNETNNPKTGDNIMASVMLFGASIIAIGTLTVVNRKKSKK